MDGNRRWAKNNNVTLLDGYKKGLDTLKSVIIQVKNHNIRFLTLYAFSSENWQRSLTEVKHLKNLLNAYLSLEKDYFIKNKIKFKVIGDYVKFKKQIATKIEKLQEATKDFNDFTLIIALNYGGREEILYAVNNLILDKSKNTNFSLSKAQAAAFAPINYTITEEIFSNYLYTKDYPDPDLIIRTGGHKRLSNFLPWQSIYTELFFTDVLWPDFNKEKLDLAINFFNTTSRKRGK